MPPGPIPGVRVDVSPDLGRAVRGEVTALVDAVQEADDYPGLSDQGRLALEEDPPRSTLSLLARVGDGGTLAGYATLGRGGGAEGPWSVETVVAPASRRQAAGVHGALLDAALAEAAARGGGEVRVWLRSPQGRDAADMDERGLRAVRELLQLRGPIPAEAVHHAGSPPVPVRPFRPGHDEEAWLRVNARAFADHPEQGAWRLEDLQRREREPWFDPGGFLLHEVGDRLAAFCWTKVHRTPVLGEIYVIGVDPDFQGRGLGRSLTRAGIGHLATRAVRTAMLYVEATNTPALVLYRSLGFTEHHREVMYTRDVPAASRQADAPTARPIP